MTSRDPTGPRRNPGSSNRATLLELFFDVFYVAMFAQLSMQFARNPSWGGLGQTFILLLAAWWTWSTTVNATEFYDPQLRALQGVVTGTVFGVALMTVAVPAAYGGRGLLFAGAYVGIHLLRGLLLIVALRPQRAHAREQRFLFWFGLSGILWLAGGLAGPAWRTGLWAGAIAVDYLAAALRYPTPLRGRIPTDHYSRLSVHFGERYQQIATLALGELALMSTLRFSRATYTPARAVAFLTALVTALLFWQIYALQSNKLVDRSAHRRPQASVELAPYVYTCVVTGVIATSGGVDLVLHDPHGATPWSWVLLIAGGPVLFVLGRMGSEYVLLNQLPPTRLAWLALLLAATPVLTMLAPVLTMIASAAVLVGITITDVRRIRRVAPAD
ncbi:low temperature requirement protein A [Micromonospora chokoriensis]|uniref:Low temperature requirement protein LtrA n=1 Tax=Micromonospora chokoriensis TaxID=356851 RepID=A0A1C4VGD9_9ACTN|nr:low temperature requirement protein A [Micromonospora chokoriensis]SCE83020.1 Low temperature requirement protein LtrA [Micromonospora chokoriensis]